MSKPKKPWAYAAQLIHTELFCGLETEQLTEILQRPELQICCYQPGEAMRRPGTLGILISGRARVTKETDSGQVIMNELTPSMLFGAVGLFSGQFSPASAPTAVTACVRSRALFIPEGTLLDLLAQNTRLMCNYLCYLTSRIRFLNKRMDGFLTGSAQERLHRYLVEHCQDGVWKPAGMTDLSKRLSISRSSLYRALESLEREGKIRRREDLTIELL